MSNSDKQKEVMENFLTAASLLVPQSVIQLNLELTNNKISAAKKEQEDYVAFHRGVCVQPFDKLSS